MKLNDFASIFTESIAPDTSEQRLDVHLTDAAEDLLRELSKEYVNKVIHKAYALASLNHTETKELSYKNILDANKSIMYRHRERVNTRSVLSKNEWVAMLGVTFGLLYLFIGIMIKFSVIDFSISIPPDTTSIPILIGAILVFISLFFLGLIRMRKGQNAQTESDFYNEHMVVRLWAKIESLGRDILNDYGNGSINGVSSVIDFLMDQEWADNYDIKEILRVRNDLVHESSNNYTPAQLDEIISKEVSLIDKLDKQKKSR